MRESEVVTSRLRMRVMEAGEPSAPTVLLVHGNAASADFFAPTMERLGEHFHCVAPDLRGFGGSETIPVDATRGMRDFADDLHSLIAETDLAASGPIHLLGWSMGGGVAMQFLIDWPEEVASLILESPISPFGFMGSKDLAGTPCWPDGAGSGAGFVAPAFVESLRARSDDDARAVVRSVVAAPYEFDPAFEDSLVEALLAMATGDENYPGDSVATPHWPGMGPGTRGVNNGMAPGYFDASAVAEVNPRPPILWVRGEDDPIVSDSSVLDPGTQGRLGELEGWPGEEVFPPQPMVGQMRAVLERYRLRGGRYEELAYAACGHSPHLERIDEFVDAVLAFMER